MTHQHSSMVPTLPVPLSLKLQSTTWVHGSLGLRAWQRASSLWALVSQLCHSCGMAAWHGKEGVLLLITPLRLVHPKRAIICWFLPSQILPWSLRLGMEDRNPLLESLDECGLEAWGKGLSRLLCLLCGLTPPWLTLQRGYVRCFMYEYLWFCVQGKDLCDFKS